MATQLAQPQVTTSEAQAIPEYARPYTQNMMGGMGQGSRFGGLSQQQGMQGIQGLMNGLGRFRGMF
jgi:hypothetical protein